MLNFIKLPSGNWVNAAMIKEVIPLSTGTPGSREQKLNPFPRVTIIMDGGDTHEIRLKEDEDAQQWADEFVAKAMKQDERTT